MSTEASAVGKKPRLLRVVSRCTSVDDFVTVFRRFSDGESLFIVTKNPKPVGTKQPVSITLSDGVPVLAGLGEVVEAHTDGGGPAGRPGMRLKFASLDGEGRAVLKRLGEPAKKPLPRAPVPKVPLSSRATIAVATPPPPKLPGLMQAKPSAPVGKPEPEASKPEPAAVDNPAAQELDDDETTNVSDEYAMMQRATGSSLIVPANPLSELDDEALVGFVECALYEESGFVEMPETLGDLDHPDDEQTKERAPSHGDAEPGLPSWWPKNETAATGPSNGESTGSDALGTPAPGVAAIPPEVRDNVSNGIPRPIDAGFDPATTPIPPPVLPTPSAAPIMPELDQRPPPQRAETPAVVQQLAQQQSAAAPAQAVAYSNLQTAADPFDTGLVAKQFQNRGKLIAVAVVAALVSFGIGFAIWGGDDGENKTQPAAGEQTALDKPDKPAEPEAEAEAEPEAEAEAEAEAEPEAEPEAEAEAEPEPEPEPEEAAVAILTGDGCTLEVTSRPSKVPVLIGGEKAGKTPLTRSMGCGVVAVAVQHPRYNAFTQNVTLSPGTSGTLHARLQRPVHLMTITSSPSGATVKIGSRTVGKTPVTAKVTGYEKAKIKISKPGYKTWSKRVYARYKKQRVFGKLKSTTKPRKRTPRKRTRTRKKSKKATR